MMRAIILAAGRGSRMGDITDSLPKCLIELAGRTLLDWQISALHTNGISDISVIAGYKSEMIRGQGFDKIINPRWSAGNMVATLCCAREILRNESCIVSYSDILYREEYVAKIIENDADLSITYDVDWDVLWKARFPDPLVDAEIFRQESGVLMEIGGRAKFYSEIGGQYMGLLHMRPDGWRIIEQLFDSMSQISIDSLDMTSLLSILIGKGMKIACVPVSGGWCEVDSKSDLLLYNSLIDSGHSWAHDWR